MKWLELNNDIIRGRQVDNKAREAQLTFILSDTQPHVHHLSFMCISRPCHSGFFWMQHFHFTVMHATARLHVCM